ncbi:MAG: M24 family metallopeptidase [Candidatus Kapabacteria bacterium]|jgi:Xaa-Pro aminopeptidase|nr:M24 family metallopeptidase [Candidatus Kapabacteria bacterium]
MHVPISQIQDALRQADIDAWVLYDFRGSNAAAWSLMGLAADAHVTRRWMVVIPATGSPVKIHARMEEQPLAHLAITADPYTTHDEWFERLHRHVGKFSRVAMEYSPKGALPAASRVDAGTIEAVRSLNVDVVSSADLLQQFMATMTDEQIAENASTAAMLRASVLATFRFIADQVREKRVVQEVAAQEYLLQQWKERGLVSDSAPIVASGKNAASPHYAPSDQNSSLLQRGDVVLIDAWAKRPNEYSVYADITWMGYIGETVPESIAQRFDVIRLARDRAVELVVERFARKEPVMGYEVDQACRNIVEQAGLGSLFIHRTGHSIYTEVHGPGANMDGFETHDTRVLLPRTSFSIEPGVYEPGILGMRTELDVVILPDGSVSLPSAPLQMHVLPLLSDAGIPSA